MKTEKQPHEILYSKPSDQVFVYDEDENTRDWYSEDDIFDAMIEYSDQFKPKWVSVEEFEGEIGQMVLVKGIMRSELGDSSEPSTGLVNWKNKDYSECSDFCYYAMWYTNITEVFIIPKTV